MGGQYAEQQQRLEAERAKQEGAGRGPRGPVETEQVDAGLRAAQAVGGRTRVAAVLRQRWQLGSHLVAVILTRAGHSGRAVGQDRAGPGEGGQRLPFGGAARVEGVRRARQYRDIDDPRGGCGPGPKAGKSGVGGGGEKANYSQRARGTPPCPLWSPSKLEEAGRHRKQGVVAQGPARLGSIPLCCASVSPCVK